MQFGLTGMGVAPAGFDKPNTGHHHLIIDATLSPAELKEPIASDAKHLHFGGGQTETMVMLPTMLSSLFAFGENGRTWSVARAAAYGAAVGAVAAFFKISGPFHAPGAAAAHVLEIASAALAFALLCAGAALARNLIARRLVWPKLR